MPENSCGLTVFILKEDQKFLGEMVILKSSSSDRITCVRVFVRNPDRRSWYRRSGRWLARNFEIRVGLQILQH